MARAAALVVGTVLLLGAAGVLAAYIAKYGIDGFAVYGLVIMALVAVLLITGASAKQRRSSRGRVAVSLLCFLSFIIFMILGFPATNSHDATAGGLLFLTGLLLTPIAPCVAILGRPAAARANRPR